MKHSSTAGDDLNVVTNPQKISAMQAGAVPAGRSELPPEEGFLGWLCVVGTFICLFCSFGFLNAICVFQNTYQQTILSAYSPSEIAWIFAAQLALMWAPGPLFGRLIDAYGPGPVLYPSTFMCVFSLCMTSLADKYYQIFLAQGLGFGIGAGGVFTASIVCVGQWFVRRRGLATGIATAGSSMGGVIFPIFLDRVMKDVGFYAAIRYTALLIGILLLASCFMIRARLPRKKWNPNMKWFDASLFRERPFALCTLGSFLGMWGVWAPLDFVSSMAQNIGFSPTLSLYLISIINATSIAGRILPPHLGDRIGHFNVLTASCCLTGGSILALWLPFNYRPSQAGIIIFAIIYGFVSGAFVSLLMPCVAKAGSLDTLGQRFGTYQMSISLSCLTGLPIMGAMLNHQHDVDYSGLQLFAGVSCLLGTLLLSIATYYLSRQNKTWKI